MKFARLRFPRSAPGHASTTDTAYDLSRHADVSRRAVLRYGAALGAGAVLAACGNDASVLRDASIDIEPEVPATTAPTTIDASGTTTAPVDSLAPDSTVPETVPSETSPPETSALPTEASTPATALLAGTEMLVTFTYQQGSGGKNESPYTAVWVEDAAGSLVHTIVLWRQQDGKGAKWLPDLTRWFTVEEARSAGGAADVISSATRIPGEYTVAWDGQVSGLGALAAGSYHVCIETSREDGPHSLIREPIELAGQPIDVVLPPDGELVAASVSVA